MTKWLSGEQQLDWRAFLSVLSLLPDQFSRDLNAVHGLTLSDYEILVRLSEAEGRSMRMSELADKTLSSRSRLTHQIDRMVEAGYVTRRVCADDKRGYFAEMTDAGWDKLVAAAPSHVESVREHLVDVLTCDEFKALGDISKKILDSLDADTKSKAL